MRNNSIKIRVGGNDFAAFIGAANNTGISLRGIKTQGKTLVCIAGKDCEKDLRRIAARCGMTFEVSERKDMKSAARGFLRRSGAFAALAALILSVAASRFFVFSVVVTGASPELAAEITASLAENGISGMTAKSRIDAEEIEKAVLNGSDDVAFAEVYVDGVKLVVSVRERLPEYESEETAGKIVAACDAIVTRVEVSGGTAAVKPGDTVRKGEVLIEDKIVVGDPLDPGHKEITTAAEGDVYGRTWYTRRLIIPEYREVTVRTGRTYVSTSLYLKDMIIFGAKADHGFGEWEKISKTVRMDSVLPFVTVTDRYYETETVTVQTDESYIESEVYAAFSSLSASLDKTATVLRSYKSQKKVDNYYIIILYYEVEQLIGCREA